MLTIVMYHYVRDAAHTPYPGIRALGIDDFEGQIDYIKKHYTVISGEDLLHALAGYETLPPRALLLTFDDGYIDHYKYVFPVLKREGLTGCFFPIAECVREHRVSDVNKIQFILSQAAQTEELIESLRDLVERHQDREGVLPFDSYRGQIDEGKYFDNSDVIFIKEMLQRLLPKEIRAEGANELFQRFVSRDEETFSRELYMQTEHLMDLQAGGMTLGSHTYTHQWLGELTPEEQTEELDHSVRFLRELEVPRDAWIMCYPKGSYNESVVELLEQRGCKAGLTTDVALADLAKDHPLKLPRIDTIDLPFRPDAEPNHWTQSAG